MADDEHDDQEHEADEHDEEAEHEEETEEEYEVEDVSRTEAAAVLNAVADGVLAGAVRVGEDDDAVAVDVPESVSVEVEVEADDEEVELEVELEWDAPEDDDPVSALDEHPDAEQPDGAEIDVEDEEVAGEATVEPSVPVGAVEPVESLAGFEVFADRGGEWRWRLRHRNGNVIATSGEGYTRKHNAWKGLRSVMRNAPGASVTEDED